MPITTEQLEARRSSVGSSDVGAVLGVDPFRSAYDVWLDKTGQLEPDTSTNKAAEAGNLLENGVLDWAEEQLGKIERNVHIDVPNTHLSVNTDARLIATGEPVEAKTSGLFNFFGGDEWGDDHTDGVPDRVILQASCHMIAMESGICHIPALIGGRGFAMFQVARDNSICDYLLKGVEEFWQHVVDGTPPVESQATLEIAKRIRHIPEKVTKIDPALVEAFLSAKDAFKAAEDAKKIAQGAILTAMGDAEAAHCGEFGAMTYYEQSRKEYICKASTFRVLRQKKKGL